MSALSMPAAVLFAALVAVLVVLQIAVAAGAPLGRYVWGGQHEGRLPGRLRIGSACSVLVYAVAALIVLDRAGLVRLFPEGFSNVVVWIVFALFAVGTLMNLASRSKRERAIMTPLAALLAVSALVVALGA
jgi:hypothetical protein